VFESGGDLYHAAKLDRWIAIILKAAALREESDRPGSGTAYHRLSPCDRCL